jgi:hypothetical protein
MRIIRCFRQQKNKKSLLSVKVVSIKKNAVSVEVLKYPYCGKTIESKEFLSEKICSATIRIRKKILKKAKQLGVYGNFILSLTNGVVPSQAIGLPILRPTSSIMRSIHSDTSKKVIIARVINNTPEKIFFTEKQMDQFYDLAVKYRNNSISREEIILELRGGEIKDWVAAFGIVVAVITVLNNVAGFQMPSGAPPPPHLGWLYGNQQPGNEFGYGKGAGPRSFTVAEMTQNAGSEKKEPSSGSYNYIDVVTELKK